MLGLNQVGYQTLQCCLQLIHVTSMYDSFNKEGGLQESNTTSPKAGPKAGPKDGPSDNLYQDGILCSTGTGGNYRRADRQHSEPSGKERYSGATYEDEEEELIGVDHGYPTGDRSLHRDVLEATGSNFNTSSVYHDKSRPFRAQLFDDFTTMMMKLSISDSEKLGDDVSRWMGESQRSDNVSIEAELSISNETLGPYPMEESNEFPDLTKLAYEPTKFVVYNDVALAEADDSRSSLAW
eukprot:Em0022g381a